MSHWMVLRISGVGGNMKDAINILLSLLIGVVATMIAKFVHPNWELNQLLIFGLVVFVITAILALSLGKRKK